MSEPEVKTAEYHGTANEMLERLDELDRILKQDRYARPPDLGRLNNTIRSLARRSGMSAEQIRKICGAPWYSPFADQWLIGAWGLGPQGLRRVLMAIHRKADRYARHRRWEERNPEKVREMNRERQRRYRARKRRS